MTQYDFIHDIPLFQVELLPDAVPKKQHPRRLNPAITKAVDNQIDEWLALDIIEEAPTTPWASPITDVPKVPGTKIKGLAVDQPLPDIRTCIDYRDVNDKTVKSQFPTALVWNELQRIGHKR